MNQRLRRARSQKELLRACFSPAGPSRGGGPEAAEKHGENVTMTKRGFERGVWARPGVCRCAPGSIFVLVLLVLIIFVGRVFIFLRGIILLVLVAVLGLAELLIEDLVDARLHSRLGLLPGKFGFELSCDSLQDAPPVAGVEIVHFP